VTIRARADSHPWLILISACGVQTLSPTGRSAALSPARPAAPITRGSLLKCRGPRTDAGTNVIQVSFPFAVTNPGADSM
jgi:hypothetical protein